MGIENFYGYVNNYAVYHPSVFKTFDHLYIDLNVIEHRSVTGAKTPNSLLASMVTRIEHLLKYNKPKKSLTLAVDNIAALAKIPLQRHRRLKSSRSHDVKEVSPLMFTPGTFWTKSLEMNLKKDVDRIKQKYGIEIFCRFDGVGEAEMKIISQAHNNNKNGETHCVCTSDSDVFVIICGSLVPRFYIDNGKQTINVDKTVERMNIDKQDFSFLSLLMGNDYLPKMSFVSFPKLINCYKNTRTVSGTNLVNNTIVNRHFLIEVIKQFESHKQLNIADNTDYNNYYNGLVWCLNATEKASLIA